MKEKQYIFLTAVLEGCAVLVVEIAGARALAPYFGSSLKVWTAQITATLLFLALGYGLGGRLSKKQGEAALPAVFWIAGLWLALYPFLRVPVLGATVKALGVAGGSFLSSALIFGPPLLCMGAVSPLLIARLDRVDAGAGAAAGRLFFVNTLGGLAGGWITALVLIPHFSLRLSLAGLGVILFLIGSAWGWGLKRLRAATLGGPALVLFFALIAPSPARGVTGQGWTNALLWSRQSGVGLIQVADLGTDKRALFLDGITQGGMSKETGTSDFEFTEYQNFLSWRYHPKAKKALLLGLGTGLLAKQLHNRSVDVTVAELEPQVELVARRFFGLPQGVKVVAQDARAFLERDQGSWDLIFLDAFAGENAPWYLATEEAAQRYKQRLAPGGRLVINVVTRREGSPALDRLEASLLSAFPQVKVFIDQRAEAGAMGLVNAALIAGENLKPSEGAFPSKIVPKIEPMIKELLKAEREAKKGGRLNRDDASDLDYADAGLRAQWRLLVLESLGPGFLSD